ncbi:hypothetical protein BDZ90DRAFT_232259 [Jaminaea rosea]|uniref:Uncharacterized protein n=1 Tax=Jaminaea rosea TaxID=1569628 RepID=A0A316UPP8_9BASI|nr:hypothetical protein BDZ90DRAFT_232259 [Jaminaea rosea]PWN27276.1 hypothetical protein BDZ90DRAFT_232259 [Jaminaea rosea]
MPSNQRPLTRPRPKSTSGVLYVAAAPLVLRAGNFLTLFCTLFLSLSLLFTLRSPDDVASAARGLEGYVAGGLKSAAAGRTGVTGTKGCRPLRLPGWIDLGGGSASASAQPKWSTFDSLCPESSIVSSLSSSSSSSASLPWLANRTLLVVGDEEPTHSRLERLCGTLGGRSAKVDVAHPWGQALERVEGEVAKLGMGSYCYVERVDLLIHHLPHTGLAPLGSHSVESRLSSLLLPLLTSWSSPSHSSLPSLPHPRRRRSPDLTIWSSYTADLASLTDPAGDKVGAAAVGQMEKLNWWRRRNLEALQHLKNVAGGGKVAWMSPGHGDGDAVEQGQEGMAHMAAALETLLLSPAAGDRFLANEVPYSLRVPTHARGAASWWAGEVPWRRVSEGLVGMRSKGAKSREDVEAGLWGEVLLGTLAEVV